MNITLISNKVIEPFCNVRCSHIHAKNHSASAPETKEEETKQKREAASQTQTQERPAEP